MHNIKIKYGFIQGITRSGIYHAREGGNPPILKQMFGDSRTCMKLNAWIIYQFLAHILTWWKQTEECFQDRDERWNFPDLHARRISQGGSGSCQASAQLWVHWGDILTWYWTLSAEEYQSQHHSLLKNNHPAAVSPVFNWWRIYQYCIPTLLKWHLFSSFQMSQTMS